MKLTPYFGKIVLNKRLEINLDWCNVLRVVTLDDGETVHNAFFDRNFRKQLTREGTQI